MAVSVPAGSWQPPARADHAARSLVESVPWQSFWWAAAAWCASAHTSSSQSTVATGGVVNARTTMREAIRAIYGYTQYIARHYGKTTSAVLLVSLRQAPAIASVSHVGSAAGATARP